MRTPHIFSLIVAILFVAGCGSSSSSNNSAGNQETVTLSGSVTDRPIQDATVTATVDGQTFTADQPTASDGSYQIQISSDDPDALVRLEAVDPSGQTRLSAIVDSFEAIEEAVEDPSQDEDYNITNITTAQEVLATQNTEDGSIDSKEELIDAVARVQTDDLLEVSAAIKLVVDGVDGVTLPAGVDDTKDLAAAIVSGESTFIESVEQSAPGALDNAIDLVLSDGNATIPWDPDSVPGVYVSQDNAAIFAFLADGSGFAQPEGEGSGTMFDWQVDGDGLLELFYADSTGSGDAVTLLGRTDDIVNVVVREDGASDAGSPSTALYYSFAGAFTSENVPGSYSSLDDPGHVTVFEVGGTGHDLDLTTGVAESEFTWSVDSAGTLTLVDGDGSSSAARRLTGSTDDNLYLFITDRDATGGLIDVAIIDVLRTDAEVGSNEANALLLAGRTYAMTEATEVGLFDFGIDGSFHEILQEQDADGTWSVAEGTGTWAVDAEGVITLQFPNEPLSGGAQVVSGLGEDFMVVQTGSEPDETIQVLRTQEMELAMIVGSFSIQDDANGVVSESVIFDDDFSGVHVDEAGTAQDFTWQLSEGRLVVQTSGSTSFENETLTFHMLSGSSGDVVRVIGVERINGVLRAVDPTSTDSPDTLTQVTLIRTNG